MSNTLMGTLQQAIRNTFGCANDFNGDLHVLCDYWGIPMVPISGRTIDVSRKYDASITDATSALNYLLYNPTIAVPALGLNFVNNETLDPRITFSRTSNATQFDSAGNLVYAPHNLLTFSEQFDNSAWSKTNATVAANTSIAPNGTTTGDSLIETAVAGQHQASQNLGTTTVGAVLTFSVYAKANTRSRLALTSFGEAIPVFNLANGTVVTSGGVPTSITFVGDGWYRCSITITKTNTTNVWYCLLVDTGTNISYTGDGVSGLFLWGAQLNIGTLQPYNTTTVKNLLGFTQEFDNAAWAKSNSFVQTNQIRNNTMQGAVAGTPGTLPTNWSVSGTATSSVIGAGTENGISYIDVRFQGAGAADAFNLFFDGVTQIAALNGQSWTGSFYLKLVGGSVANLSLIQRLAFRNSGGANIQSVDTSSLVPTSAALSTQRTTLSLTAVQATTAFVTTALNSGTPTGAFDITLRIGWPQLVQGAVAGDPVATYGTARAVMYPAPDGSVTGDKLVENAGAGAKQLFQTVNWLNGTRSAWSIYAKAAERGFLYFSSSATVFPSGGVLGYVNLNTGATSSVGANCTITATSVGNGWWRCCLIATPGATATNPGIDIRISANGSDAGSYTGDGTSGIFIWGAQLSDSASLDPYVYNPVAAPTAAAYYGPRFDYDPATLAARGLLIEEQRTNLCLQSQAISTSPWAANGPSDTCVPSALIDPAGGLNAFEVTTEAVAFGRWAQAITVVSGTTYTISAWVRSATGTMQFRLRFAAGVSSADLTATTTWQRFTFTATAGSTSGGIGFQSPSSGAATLIHVYGAQLEAGAFATSYIPTTTAAATRTADVATMVGANFSNWYRQDEGTLYVEGLIPFVGGSGFPSFASVDDGTANDAMEWSMWDAAGDSIRYVVYDNNVPQASIAPATYTANSVAKLVGAYKVNDFAAAYNGGAALTDTSGALPVVSTARIGQNRGGGNFLNGYVRRISYFQRRLTDAQLSAVTA